MKMPDRVVAALIAIGLPGGLAAVAQQQPGQHPPAKHPPAQPPPAGQQPPAQQGNQQQPPTIRTGINYVRVDALVSDKNGNPVMDLAQDEFSIAEDGKPQRIE